DVLDPETTAARRDEAAAAVRAVYDFDALALDQARRRLAASFQLMRDADAERAAKTPPPPAFFEERRDAFTKALQAVPSDADFKELARDRFSEAAERAAARLVADALGGLVIADRALLRAERERGIAVRSVGAEGPERLVRDVY